MRRPILPAGYAYTGSRRLISCAGSDAVGTCMQLVSAISVHAVLSVLIRRAFEVALHEFREARDGLVSALLGRVSKIEFKF